MDAQNVARYERDRTDRALQMPERRRHLSHTKRTVTNRRRFRLPVCMFATKRKCIFFLYTLLLVLIMVFLFKNQRLRCQRKEPCKLFTVRKRQEFLDEVNTNPLCQCPRNHHCPNHHMDAGVLVGKSYIEDNIRTYSGFCMPDERKSTQPHKTRK